MPTVRTTMQPDREIEVDDAEYVDLQRQGLLVEDDHAPVAEPEPTAPAAPAAPEQPAAAAAPAAPVKKTPAGPAGSKES